MTDLRPVFSAVLCAVLVLGGVVLPSAHRAEHGMEAAEARASHIEAYHGDHEAEDHDAASGALATAPCAPAPNDVDCAVCSVLTVAVGLAAAPAPFSGDSAAISAATDRAHTVAHIGTGARAPPVV